MAMPIEKLVQQAPDVIGGTWANRFDYAASILFVHGYIPESQRKKIADKMNSQFVDGIDQGLIIERQVQP